jgi:shikimate dehydrogenase
MHNAAYEAMGLDWVYFPMPVEDEPSLYRLISAVKNLPFVGLNVTMPYKEAMLSLCDEVAALAQMAGAVNAVHCVDGRLIGYNTDGRGFLESLEKEAGFLTEGKQVCVIGAGGAAGAALVGLILAKAASVTVANRSIDRADELIARIGSRARNTELRAVGLGQDAEPFAREADLVINATSVGMRTDDPSPVPASWLRAEQVVADMVYRPAETELLRLAAQVGATTLGGLGMLVNQGATSIEIWDHASEAVAPRDIMRDAAEKTLANDGNGV